MNDFQISHQGSGSTHLPSGFFFAVNVARWTKQEKSIPAQLVSLSSAGSEKLFIRSDDFEGLIATHQWRNAGGLLTDDFCCL